MKHVTPRLSLPTLLLAAAPVLGACAVLSASADAAPIPYGSYRVQFDDSVPRHSGYTGPRWRTGYSGYSRLQSLHYQNRYWLRGRVYRTYRNGQYYSAPRPSGISSGGRYRRHAPYRR